MEFKNGNGNGFHGSNGFPRPLLTRILGQGEIQIPPRPAGIRDFSSTPAGTVPRLIPLEVWPLAAGVAMLGSGFVVNNKDAKTVLFGLGSTLTGVSTIALFAKI